MAEHAQSDNVIVLLKYSAAIKQLRSSNSLFLFYTASSSSKIKPLWDSGVTAAGSLVQRKCLRTSTCIEPCKLTTLIFDDTVAYPLKYTCCLCAEISAVKEKFVCPYDANCNQPNSCGAYMATLVVNEVCGVSF